MELIQLTFIIFCVIIGYCSDDYQVILSHSSINKLVQHLVPILSQEMLSLTIPPQTFDGVATMELGEITVHDFSVYNTTVDLNPNTQDIALNVIHMNLELNQFTFKATALGISFLSCSGTLSPAFSNWNISIAFNTLTNSCNISIHLIDSATVIQQGTINLNHQFGSTACNTLYNGADFLLNIEEKLTTEIVEKIPNMINSELQSAIDTYIGQIQSVEDITICYNNITIYINHLLIAGDLITPTREVVSPSNISTTFFIDIEDPDEPRADDASLFVFGIMIMILSCMVGCGTGIGIFCGCNKDKIKEVSGLKRTNDKIKAQPLRINDDMTDDDGEAYVT